MSASSRRIAKENLDSVNRWGDQEALPAAWVESLRSGMARMFLAEDDPETTRSSDTKAAFEDLTEVFRETRTRAPDQDLGATTLQRVRVDLRLIAGVEQKINGPTASWQDVKARMERLRDQGRAWPGQRTLAEQLGCSTGLIAKVLQRSPELKAWMEQGHKRTLPAVSLTGPVADNAMQSRESDPANRLSEEDVDSTMAKLINQADADKRAELNALDAVGRRRLAQEYCDHERDYEPSPLDDAPDGKQPHRVLIHKTV